MRCQGLGPGSVPRARRNSTRPLSQVGKWAGTGLGQPGSHSRFLVSCSFAQMSIQDTLCQGLANKPRAAGKGPSLPRGRGEQEAFGLSEKLSFDIYSLTPRFFFLIARLSETIILFPLFFRIPAPKSLFRLSSSGMNSFPEKSQRQSSQITFLLLLKSQST